MKFLNLVSKLIIFFNSWLKVDHFFNWWLKVDRFFNSIKRVAADLLRELIHKRSTLTKLLIKPHVIMINDPHYNATWKSIRRQLKNIFTVSFYHLSFLSFHHFCVKIFKWLSWKPRFSKLIVMIQTSQRSISH